MYIRGGNFDQVGYEFDGVPVNRSFDNYPGGTAGTLGQQELQLYAGGGTAGESASGLAGFINQVIKTGTFPGYANVSAGSARRRSTTRSKSKSAARLPTGCFLTTSASAATIKTSATSISSTVRISATSGATRSSPTTRRHCISAAFIRSAATAPPQGRRLYDGPNPSPVYNPFDLKPGQPGYRSSRNAASRNNPGCYQTISPAYASYSALELGPRKRRELPLRHPAQARLRPRRRAAALQRHVAAEPVLQFAQRHRSQRRHAAQPARIPGERFRKSGPISLPGRRNAFRRESPAGCRRFPISCRVRPTTAART